MTKLERLRADARKIFAAGVAGADAACAVKTALQLRPDRLEVGERTYALSGVRDIYIAGCGKAGAPMARAAEEVFGARISGGSVIVSYGHTLPTKMIEVLEAGHPIPDAAGLRGARRIMDLALRCRDGDLLLFLISGGASALLPYPASGLTLQDKQMATHALLKSGAPIHEVNAIRKHLSQVKGGRLAQQAAPAHIISLILSDVIDDAPETVGSGPTAPDPTTYEDCLTILERYKLVEELPSVVLDILTRGVRQEIAETPKPSDAVFERVQNVVVANNQSAVDAAQQYAESLGYTTSVLTRSMQGESRNVAKSHATLIKKSRAAQALQMPACLITGGETTVTVRGLGTGGRNQEFALAAALEIDNLDDLVILSGGTDGLDGPTDAAGGIVDGSTIARAKLSGLNGKEYLERNDSYHFLHAVGDLLITGPTLTNVMDLQITLLG